MGGDSEEGTHEESCGQSLRGAHSPREVEGVQRGWPRLQPRLVSSSYCQHNPRGELSSEFLTEAFFGLLNMWISQRE